MRPMTVLLKTPNDGFKDLFGEMCSVVLLCVTVNLCRGTQALPSHPVGGGWSRLMPRPPLEKKNPKSSHSQRARSVSRRGHGAAELPLKLSLSLSSVCPPSSFILSLNSFFCLPLFILPPPCHFSILCLTLISPMDFLIHEL